MSRTTRTLLGLAVAGLVAGAWSCAETVGDIDRTQPDKLEKSLFRADKTWYYKQTIIDVPPKTTWTFEGVGSDLFKIRFEVQGETLFAYRAHEHSPGQDPDVDPDWKDVGATHYIPGEGEGVNPDQYKEAPIQAWEIGGHFDVIREYNSTTGEQQNVLVENVTDRPWYERQYMRVNWAKGLGGATIPGYNGNLINAPLSGHATVVSEGQEPDGSPDSIRFERADGTILDSRTEAVDDSVVYFDYTEQKTMEPSFCFRGEPADCTPERIKIRHSFWRIDDNRDQDYEAAIWDDIRQSKFGYFRTERFSYDRQRGEVDSGRIYLVNRHRTWEHSNQRTADGTFKRTPAGDRIPIDFFNDGVPRPIVYALNPEHPDNLVETAQGIADDWDRAFRRSTAAACGVEVPDGVNIDAVPVGEPGKTCKQYREAGEVPRMYVLDKNEDGAKRAGDLRHSFMYWVDQAQAAGPLGFGPSYGDPETGELISGIAHIYGAQVDTYAAYAMDIVDVLGDFLTVEDLADGEHIRAHIEAGRDRVDPRRMSAQAAKQNAMSAEDFEALDVREAVNMVLPQASRPIASELSRMGLPEGSPFYERWQADRVKGTGLEQLLLRGTAGDEIVGALSHTKEFKQLAPNWHPGDPVPEEAFELINPSNWAYGSAMREMEADRIEYFSTRNVMMADFEDDAIIGLALDFEGEKDPAKVYQALRADIYKATMLHELGHTIGLRHNFEGSFDATNFHDQYWDQRSENLQNIAASDDFSVAKINKESEFTEAQKQGRMREYQYSSIMDYGMKFNSDFQGLGKYDEAAILMGYANSVEVFEEPRTDVLKRLRDYMLKLSYSPDFDFEGYLEDTWENRTHPQDNHPLRHFNYTHMPYFVGGTATDNYLALRQRKVRDYDEVRLEREAGLTQDLEVPYMFCGDEWVSSIVSCNRWDLGANYQEIQSAAINAYYNYYFFDHFRREQIDFNPNAVMSRVYERYFRLISDTYRFGLWAGVFWGGLPDPVLSYMWQTAIVHGLDTLLNVISTPEYGTYRLADDGRYHQWKYDIEPGPGNFVVQMGQGRRRHTRYYWDEGYNYYDYPVESGHFWDWLVGLISLTESTFTVLGVEVQSDFRTYSIPYYLLFPEKLTRWFNAMAMRDSDGYGPRVFNNELKFLTQMDKPEGNPLNLRPDFTTQFYAMMYGMQSFQSNFSLHYVDQMQVFRVGSGEQMSAGPEYEILTFSDPTTGHQYGTFRKKAGYDEAAGDFKPPPVQMMEELNVTKARWLTLSENDNERQRLEQQMNDRVESLNILRGLYEVFGKNI